MKVRHLKSASAVIKNNGTKVLTDPWLVDGEYYGSWALYPELEFDPEKYNDVDYIYISHIHPDHASLKTLQQMDTDIPILIHDYQSSYLHDNLTRLGFDVIEIQHDERFELDDDFFINILAADGCNPQKCGQFFGCGWFNADQTNGTGSTQIDTLAVFDDENNTIVNINDCPFDLAEGVSYYVKEQYGKIDFLLTPYAGAGPYPQCFENLTEEEKMKEAVKKKKTS